MQREPTLADLLADDAGNLRPEVAEMLMRPAPRRRPRRRGIRAIAGPRPQRTLPRWLLFLLALALAIIIMPITKAQRNKRPAPAWPSVTERTRAAQTTSQVRTSHVLGRDSQVRTFNQRLDPPANKQNKQKHPLTAVSVSQPENQEQQKVETAQVRQPPQARANFKKHKAFAYKVSAGESTKREDSNIGKHNQTRGLKGIFPSDKRNEGQERREVSKPKTTLVLRQAQSITQLGQGRVFGYKVNVRQYPSLRSPVIRKTNQGEVFPVLSFSDGWYHILLESGRPAYIFGAYLLPMGFTLTSHSVGIARDRKKLLLTSSEYPSWYQVILPTGERRYIRKSHVRIVR